MRALIDTHVFLWYVLNDSGLSRSASEIMNSRNHKLVLSYASAWELAIKSSIGKLTVVGDACSFVQKHVALNDIDLLEIKYAHIAHVAKLPLHHRDPFDRMLAAQCLAENIPIVSADSAFDAYGIQRIW